MSATGRAATPAGPRGEPFDPPEVAWTRVSPRLAVARRLLTCGPLLAAAVLAAVGAVGVGASWLWAVAAALAVAAVWAWVTIGRQVRAWGYAERADDLLVRRGVMWRAIVVVPYGRMQYVD